MNFGDFLSVVGLELIIVVGLELIIVVGGKLLAPDTPNILLTRFHCVMTDIGRTNLPRNLAKGLAFGAPYPILIA
jgi:hypothetical protein